MPLTAFKNSVWFKSCDFLKNSEMGWILLLSSFFLSSFFFLLSSSNALIFFEFYPSDHENFWHEASTYPWIRIRAGIILNFLFFRQKLRFYSLTRLVFFLGRIPYMRTWQSFLWFITGPYGYYSCSNVFIAWISPRVFGFFLKFKMATMVYIIVVRGLTTLGF